MCTFFRRGIMGLRLVDQESLPEFPSHVHAFSAVCPLFPFPRPFSWPFTELQNGRPLRPPFPQSACQFPVHCRRIHLNGKISHLFCSPSLPNCFAQFTCDLHSAAVAGENEEDGRRTTWSCQSDSFSRGFLIFLQSSKARDPADMTSSPGKKVTRLKKLLVEKMGKWGAILDFSRRHLRLPLKATLPFHY